MCGAVLSKFKRPGNKVAPAATKRGKIMLVSYSRRVQTVATLRQGRRSSRECKTNEKSTQTCDGGCRSTENWESESGAECLPGSTTGSESNSTAGAQAGACLIDTTLNSCSVQTRKYPKVEEVDREIRVIKSAKEILGARLSRAPSTSRTNASRPLSATRSVPTGDASNTSVLEAHSSSGVPRRLRKLENQPSSSAVRVDVSRLAAEEKRLNELENLEARTLLGEHSRGKYRGTNAEMIATKQAAAEKRRKGETERKKQARFTASPDRTRVAEAQALVRTEFQSTIVAKMEKTEQNKEENKQQIDSKTREREFGASSPRVKENVSGVFSCGRLLHAHDNSLNIKA